MAAPLITTASWSMPALLMAEETASFGTPIGKTCKTVLLGNFRSSQQRTGRVVCRGSSPLEMRRSH